MDALYATDGTNILQGDVFQAKHCLKKPRYSVVPSSSLPTLKNKYLVA